MNKTIKEATIHRYYYKSQDPPREHLSAFISAYNFAKRLKALHGLTPWEFTVKSWTLYTELFKIKLNPYKQGLNNCCLIVA